MNQLSPLKYKDDADRAYGIAGMTIALVLWDGEPYLAAVSLDAPVGNSIEFAPAFGFSGNPRLMASLAWREMLKQFELTSAMIMGNAICRAYVGASSPMTAQYASTLKSIIRDHGRDTCQLEDDEIDIVYNKTHRYLDRVFSHSGVSVVARNFAGELQRRRTMTAAEVFEMLESLNRM